MPKRREAVRRGALGLIDLNSKASSGVSTDHELDLRRIEHVWIKNKQTMN
jgi:hypothetical protein